MPLLFKWVELARWRLGQAISDVKTGILIRSGWR